MVRIDLGPLVTDQALALADCLHVQLGDPHAVLEAAGLVAARYEDAAGAAERADNVDGLRLLNYGSLDRALEDVGRRL